MYGSGVGVAQTRAISSLMHRPGFVGTRRVAGIGWLVGWRMGGGERLCGLLEFGEQDGAGPGLSGTDESGVQGAREGDVGGALDEGAAVGEDGEGVWAAAEAKQQIVGAEGLDVGVGLEAGF